MDFPFTEMLFSASWPFLSSPLYYITLFHAPFHLHAQPTTVLYICAHSLCLSFCSAPVVRPYEMNWYKWHFMGLCSTTRLNTAGNHKSHCLLSMPLLMCSIWFNASDRWGENRRWGLGGEVEQIRMEIKGINRWGKKQSNKSGNERMLGTRVSGISVVTRVLTSGFK